MLLQHLEHVRELFHAQPGSLVGVGMTAFSRIAPASFLDAYHVAALSRTADLPILRKRASVFCLEEAGGVLGTADRHSAGLLAHELTRAYLDRLPRPTYLLLYQSYPELECLARKEGWVLLANPADLRFRFRERAFFQQMSTELGLCQVPGAIYPVADALGKSYPAWARELGPEWVIQLPDIGQGGGRGTFFIRSADTYDRLRDRLRGHIWRGTPLTSILIRRWVQGTPASVAVCITRHGVLISGLQRQLIDLSCGPNTGEDGIFCGHVWDGDPWDAAVRASALEQAEKIGKHVAAMGYRGILGIDFVIDQETHGVYPLEINPRFTGAFPMLSFLHMQHGLVPLDAFHLIEFLNIPCRVDVEGLNRRYQEPLKGSHLVLFFPPKARPVRGFGLRAGIHEIGFKNGAVRFVRDGIGYADIQNDNQFIVADGPPAPEVVERSSRDPFSRLCHLLFPSPVADAGGDLFPPVRRVLDWIYGMEGDGS